MNPQKKFAVFAGATLLLLGGVAYRETRDLPTAAEVRSQLWTRYIPKGRSNWVPLWAISPKLQTAVLIWEDPRFYHHHGFDFGEIGRAFLEDAWAGRYRRGGSTITQQVAKNLFLSPEKSLRRKFKEAILARRLERTLTKDEILEIYLNIAQWGDAVAGAEAASRLYFSKSAADLSWAEAALLAGILPNPRRFSPIRAPEEAKRLRQVVLLKLLDSGQVTPQEYKEAASAPWRGAVPPASIENAAGRDLRFSHLSSEGKR